MKTALNLSALLLIALTAPAFAGPQDFTTGPVIEDFGPFAPISTMQDIAPDTVFRVAFDAAKASDPGKLNRTLEGAARFINMHASAGVDPANIDLAVIVHGGAAFDLLKNDAYAKANDDATNANAPLIAALVRNGVRVILCGQTAAYRDIDAESLLPGVEVDLSAMTAHARLQQDGYTLNPF